MHDDDWTAAGSPYGPVLSAPSRFFLGNAEVGALVYHEVKNEKP